MHRFLTSALAGPEPFSPAQTQQIARVLRLRSGERVELFDGRGRRATFVLEAVGAASVCGSIIPGSERQVRWPLPVRPLLSLALIRPQRFEWAIEKATELAAWRIVPLLTERTAHGSADLSQARLRRWQNIAIEAAEQCGAAFVPEVAPPLALAAALRTPAALRLFASTDAEDGERGTVRAALRDLQIAGAGMVGDPEHIPEVPIFVGPEGGFSQGELALARESGCRLVTLGPLTLRAETAALAALVALGEALRDTPNPE